MLNFSIENIGDKLRDKLGRDFYETYFCSGGKEGRKPLNQSEFERIGINSFNTKVYISKCRKDIESLNNQEKLNGTYTKEMFLKILYFFFSNTKKGTKIKIQLANNLSKSLNGGIEEGFMTFDEQKKFILSLADKYLSKYDRKNDIEIIDFSSEYKELTEFLSQNDWIEKIPKKGDKAPSLNNNSNSKDFFIYLGRLAAKNKDFADWILSCMPKDLLDENWTYPNYLKQKSFYYTIAEVATRSEDYIKGIINHLGADRQREYYDVRFLGSIGIIDKPNGYRKKINRKQLKEIININKIASNIQGDYNKELLNEIYKIIKSDDFKELLNLFYKLNKFSKLDEKQEIEISELDSILKIIKELNKKFSSSKDKNNLAYKILSAIQKNINDVKSINLSILGGFKKHINSRLPENKTKEYNGIYFETDDSIYERIEKGNPIVNTTKIFRNLVLGIVGLTGITVSSYQAGSYFEKQKQNQKMGQIIDDFLTSDKLSFLKDKNGNKLQLEDKREVYKMVYSEIIDNFGIRFNFEQNKINETVLPSVLFSELTKHPELLNIKNEQFGEKITEFVDRFIKNNETFLKTLNIDIAPYKKLKYLEDNFIKTINYNGLSQEQIITDYFNTGCINIQEDYKIYNSKHLYITSNGNFGTILYFYPKKRDIILKDLDDKEFIIDEENADLIYFYKPDFNSSIVLSGKEIAFDYFWQTRPILKLIFSYLVDNVNIDENILKEKLIKYYINNEKYFLDKYKDLQESKKIKVISEEIKKSL